MASAPTLLNQPSEEQRRLVRRSKELLPAGTTTSVVPPDGLEFIVDHGDGAYLYDVDGRRYLDFFLGAGPLVLGHAHPRLVQTIQQSAAKGTHHFGLHRRTVELAERLVQYVPSAEMVRFAASGSEATFHALRLARAVTGRQGVIKFDGAYHGHHDLAVWSYEQTPIDGTQPTAESRGIQAGVGDNIVVLPFNDPGALRQALNDAPERFAAVICEPHMRSIPPNPGYLEAMREACDRTGTVLIFDEIVTGFRLAPGGGQECYGVTPDVTTLGKAMTGGMPMSAVVGKRAFMEHFDPASAPEQYAFHCGTYNGYYLAAECAHTTLDILIEEGGIAQLHHLGSLAREKLERVFVDAGEPVSMNGHGPMFHPYFSERRVENNADVRASDLEKSAAFHCKLVEGGIYKEFVKGYVGLPHTEDHLDELARVAAWALAQLKG
jgi:glutamate-1-semialdehyde 2,1-aminomutase